VNAIQERRVALAIAKVHNMAVKQSRCDVRSFPESKLLLNKVGRVHLEEDVVEGSNEVPK
jgi:hypothetical protein